jgi:hypothetical protein
MPGREGSATVGAFSALALGVTAIVALPLVPLIAVVGGLGTLAVAHDEDRQQRIEQRSTSSDECLRCAKTRTNYSLYCREHQCITCFEGRPSNSNYCEAHQCASCYDGRSGNSRYCEAHQCRSTGCCEARPSRNGSLYCEEHQCRRCYDCRPSNSEYCGAHQCGKCYDGRLINSRYCEAHQCRSSGCCEARPSRQGSLFCPAHQCSNCSDGRREGSMFCSAHHSENIRRHLDTARQATRPQTRDSSPIMSGQGQRQSEASTRPSGQGGQSAHSGSATRSAAQSASNTAEQLPSNPIILLSHSLVAAACNNFHPSCKVGQGGFGEVYRGNMQPHGGLGGTSCEVAIKRLTATGQQVRLMARCILSERRLQQCRYDYFATVHTTMLTLPLPLPFSGLQLLSALAECHQRAYRGEAALQAVPCQHSAHTGLLP